MVNTEMLMDFLWGHYRDITVYAPLCLSKAWGILDSETHLVPVVWDIRNHELGHTLEEQGRQGAFHVRIVASQSLSDFHFKLKSTKWSIFSDFYLIALFEKKNNCLIEDVWNIELSKSKGN